MVGHRGISSNVGSNFERTAATRAAELRESGDQVIGPVDVSGGFAEFAAALASDTPIDGRVIFYGHGSYLIGPDDTAIGTLLAPNVALRADANVAVYNVGGLRANLGPEAIVELHACHSAEMEERSIAAILAHHLNRVVGGTSFGIAFSGKPGVKWKPILGPEGEILNKNPPSTGPLYSLPDPWSEWIWFDPSGKRVTTIPAPGAQP